MMMVDQGFTQDYEVLDELGRGKFGVVFKCRSRVSNDLFAVKTVDKSLVSGDCIDMQSLTTEPKALSMLSNPTPISSYVTRIHNAYDTPTHLHLVLDLVPYPSLYTLLSIHHRFSEPDTRAISSSLLTAILHCHKTGIVHRDIKPENILVDPNTKKLKLCDFGSAGFLGRDDHPNSLMTEIVGSPYYIAPEILEGNGYGEKVDVWSAGVVIYIMITGYSPFYGESVKEIFEKVVNENVRFPVRVFKGMRCLKDLLKGMLCRDVRKRLSVEEALRHPWFTSGEQTQE